MLCTVVSVFSNPHFFEPSDSFNQKSFPSHQSNTAILLPFSRTSWFLILIFVSTRGRKIRISLSVMLNFTFNLAESTPTKLPLETLNCIYAFLVHSTALKFKGRVKVNHPPFCLRELNYPGIYCNFLYCNFLIILRNVGEEKKNVFFTAINWL